MHESVAMLFVSIVLVVFIPGCTAWFGGAAAAGVDSGLHPSAEGRGEFGFGVGSSDKRFVGSVSGGGGYGSREKGYGLVGWQAAYGWGDDYRVELGGGFTGRFYAGGRGSLATGPNGALLFRLPQRASGSTGGVALMGPKLDLEVAAPVSSDEKAAPGDAYLNATLALVVRWAFVDDTHDRFHF
jgi:hypothetical protein